MKKIIFLTLFLTIFLISCGKEIAPEKIYEVKATKVEVSSETIIQSYTSTVESKESITILSEIPGKILNITKKEGDTVKSGEVIGEIQNNEAKTIYSSQNQTISQLENLKKQTQELYNSKIDLYEEKLKTLEKNKDISDLYLEQSQNTTQSTTQINQKQLLSLQENIKSLEKSIENNQIQEKNIKDLYEKNIETVTQNAKNAQLTSDAFIKNILEKYDIFYGATLENKNRNDEFEIYIGAKNTSLKNKAEQELLNLINTYNILKNTESNSKEETKIMLEKYHNFLQNEVISFLQLDAEILNESVESPTLSKETLDTLKNNNLTYQNQTQQLLLQVNGNFILGIKGSLDTLEKLEKEYKKDIENIQNQTQVLKIDLGKYKIETEKIQLTLELQNKNTQTDESIKEKQNSIAQNSFTELKLEIESLKKEKELKIDEIQTQILQSKERQSIAGVSIQNGKIISMIDGTITKKYIQAGDTLGLFQPMFEIANSSLQKTVVEVDNETLKYMKINDKVNVSSLTHTGNIAGIVQIIYPEQNSSTKNRKVEIVLEKNNTFTSGESIKIDFFPPKILGLWINKNSLVQKYNTYGVWEVKNNTLQFQGIEKLKENDSKVLIDGVQTGAIIVSNPSTRFLGGEKVKIIQ